MDPLKYLEQFTENKTGFKLTNDDLIGIMGIDPTFDKELKKEARKMLSALKNMEKTLLFTHEETKKARDYYKMHLSIRPAAYESARTLKGILEEMNPDLKAVEMACIVNEILSETGGINNEFHSLAHYAKMYGDENKAKKIIYDRIKKIWK